MQVKKVLKIWEISIDERERKIITEGIGKINFSKTTEDRKFIWELYDQFLQLDG